MRALRIVLILLAVLSLVFVAADRITVRLAQDEAADRIQATQGLAGNTQVLIKGFPFLTQVARSRLDQIEIRMSGFTNASDTGHTRVTIAELHAQLYDIRLGDGYHTATAARAEGSALIAYDALSATSNNGFTVAYGGNGRVRVTAQGDSATADVDVIGGDTIRLGGQTALERTVAGLPDGMRLDSVTPTADGLSVTVSGKDVRIAG